MVDVKINIMQSSKKHVKQHKGAQSGLTLNIISPRVLSLSLSLYPKPSLEIVPPTNINPLKLNATQQITYTHI